MRGISVGPTGNDGYKLPVEFITPFGSKRVMSSVAIGECVQGSESCCEKEELPNIAEKASSRRILR